MLYGVVLSVFSYLIIRTIGDFSDSLLKGVIRTIRDFSDSSDSSDFRDSRDSLLKGVKEGKVRSAFHCMRPSGIKVPVNGACGPPAAAMTPMLEGPCPAPPWKGLNAE